MSTHGTERNLAAGAAVTLRRGVPLTPMQRALWTSQRQHRTSPLQNMALLTHFDGSIDVDRLVAAFGAVVAASDTLRSRIVDADGSASVRVVAPGDGPGTTEVVCVERADSAEWARKRVMTPLDVSQCGYDSVIVQHSDGTTSWYLALHHTLTDATSSQLVFEATQAAYRGEPLAIGSYYAWERERARSADRRRDRAETHWANRATPPGIGRLYRPVRTIDPTSERVEVPLDASTEAAASAMLNGDFAMISEDLAWSTLLVTTAALHLHRITGVDRVAIGLPLHNRGDGTARTVIGPVMELFPVDVEIEPTDTYRTLHRRVSRSVLTTVRHGAPGTAPANPGVEAVVNVIARAGLGSFDGIATTTEWIHPGATDPSHLFRLQLTNYGPTPSLVLDLNCAAAAPEHRQRAPHHVKTILTALLTNPDAPIGSTPLCTPTELAVLETWGTGPTTVPVETMVVDRLGAALSNNNAVVLEDGERRWTGPELWSWVCSTAAWLGEAGVGVGDRVALDMARSAETVVAMLGTLVAGASYVPLEPNHPQTRRTRLIERAGAMLVLTSLPDRGQLPPGSDPVRVVAADEAYLLFTSGSTGEPKGVPINHGGLDRYLRFALDNYVDPQVAPVVPLFSALTFDLTVTSLFLPLLAGGRLVVIDEDGPAAIRFISERTDLTWCKATPSHLELLVRLLGEGHNFRTLVVGGEAFPSRLAQRLAELLDNPTIFNEYGPTEAVVGCMIHEAGQADEAGRANEPDVPIGRPAPDVSLVVMDRYGQQVPPGASGELWIAAEGLTEGYLGTDGSTDDGSTGDGPFVAYGDRRYYRSGDVVRLIDDETLTYLGRTDSQIKVGGIRLEPTEVAQALTEHPAIESAVVRLWSPRFAAPARHCVRCGLPSNVPGSSFDAEGVCATCHSYDTVKVQASEYFRTPEDLEVERDRARAERGGRYDCIHLLSGGKDSTYALYQLVAHGFSVYALTLDNGFISEGAKDNVRRTVADLGVDHEFVTTDAMGEIFRDSLERFSNVCNGCYKTIYTVATNRAVELGAPLIVTGLSRGQLFETRLVPAQFTADRFDPDAIDRAVISARKAYHRGDDAVKRLLDTDVFADDDLFERVRYLDFYRYVDVELSEMLRFLDTSAPWVRPKDTGRSTNCLINDAGIHTHLLEQGFHNYAVPYAWDVRLGHKNRDEAMAELDDRLDPAAVAAMLSDVGYEPKARQVLTAWFELAPGAVEPEPVELRTFLAGRLARHAVPQAFVCIDQLPVTNNGKLDEAALPAPSRVHRPGPALYVSPESATQRTIVSLWERLLSTEPISVDDDFFALGGDSLAALEMAMALSFTMHRTVREELVFVHTTPRTLATALDATALDATAPAVAVPLDGPSSPVARASGEAPPMSIGEQSVLFEHLSAPQDPRYNVGRHYRVRGAIDIERLVAALRDTVSAHVPLHWTYSEPRAALNATDAIAIEVFDAVGSNDELAAAATALHRAPFDLGVGPLGRCRIQRAEDGSLSLVAVFHHISVDAGSFDRLWTEVGHRYFDRSEDLTPTVDYSEHAAWQASRWTDEDRAFWSAPALVRPTADLTLIDPSSAAVPTGESGYVQRPATMTLDELRTGPGRTPFATVVAALVTVLRSRADADAIAVGYTASTRDHVSAEPLIGYYLNTLPIVVDCALDDSFSSVARRCGTAIGSSLVHRTYPFAHIVADRRRDGLQAPDASILVAFEELADASLGPFEASHEILASGSSVTGATFFVQVRGNEFGLGVEFDGLTLDSPNAVRLLDDVCEVLDDVIARPGTVVEALGPVARRRATIDAALTARLSDRERSDILGSWRSTPRALHPATRLIDVLSDGCALAPNEPAVMSATETITHAELHRRANQLATRLRAAGVGAGTLVGLEALRRPETIVAIVAIARAGGAHVPLDPDHPADRTSLIVADCGLEFVVTIEPGSPLQDMVRTVIAYQTAPSSEPASTDPGPLDPGTLEDDPAYVIYTSGSTGKPKGVMVTQRNIIESTMVRDDFYGASPERFLLLSSFAFDSSMAGLLWSLACGGAVVLADEGKHLDVVHLGERIRSAEVTHLLALPSLYRLLVEENPPETFDSLRTAIVAGEACSAEVVAAHRAGAPHAQLVNEYGPTETTVWSHAHIVDVNETGPVPIGVGIPGVSTLVLDALGRPVPLGESGELFIGGPTVTPGYLGDPVRTDARFVTLPRSLTGDVGGRFYRTGDLVSWRADGTLDFRGRIDDQVKLRGHRIELGEIEAALSAAPDVREVVVAAVGEGNQRRLVASVVAVEPNRPPQVEALLTLARAALPEIMVPAEVQILDDLPRTATGKIDRNAVPQPRRAVGAPSADQAPLTADEATMIALFEDALGLHGVSPEDDFFDLGGHSLIAIKLFARISRTFGTHLPLAILFESATPRALLANVRKASTPLDRADRTDTKPANTYVHLVPITVGDPQIPRLFCIHGLGGNVLNQRDLARALGAPWSFVGVQAAGVDGITPLMGSIDEICEAYIAEIRDMQPEGPYLIAGYSNGGMVAYEIAQRLRAAGHEMAAVVLLDTIHPDYVTPRIPMATHLKELRRLGPRYIAERLIDRRRRAARHRSDAVLDRYVDEPGVPAPWDVRERRLFTHNLALLNTYRPKPYDGHVILVSASGEWKYQHLAAHRGWLGTARDLEIVLTSGDHLSLLEGPNASVLADGLRRALERLALHRPARSVPER